MTRTASALPSSLLALTTLACLTSACIIVIDDDDDDPRPPSRPDAGPPDAWRGVDASPPWPDAAIVDGGGRVLTIETDCGPAATLEPQTLAIRGDIATVTIEHGGGCGSHAYRVCWDQVVLDSYPPQVYLELQHQSSDPCDGIIRRELDFDLGRLRSSAQGPEGLVVHMAGVSGRYRP
jgi:hypothetical protein